MANRKFESFIGVTTPDYNLFMDIQKAINLEINILCHEAGIELAFPNQTFITRPQPWQFAGYHF